MIDRLELFCSIMPTRTLEHRLSGRTSKQENDSLRRKFSHLDRVSLQSKLVREDEDIRELKTIDTNALYRNVFVEKIVADEKEGEAYDDPISFIVMADPRYKKQQKDRFKIVCNPANTPFSRLKSFLRQCFVKFNHEPEEEWLSRFRLGRVDFAFDTEAYSLEQLYRMVYVDRRLRTHISVLDFTEEAQQEPGFVRLFSNTRLGTIYVGKSQYVLRIYDKKQEAKHQIQVCKAQEWTVTETLKARAAKDQLTRIELQIRDLGRTGYVENVDIGTGEVNKVFRPTAGYHHLRSLRDLSVLQASNLDIFDCIKFAAIDEVAQFEREPWKVRAFNSHAEKVGFDQAIKELPANTRKKFKEHIRRISFAPDFKKILHGEVQKWLKS